MKTMINYIQEAPMKIEEKLNNELWGAELTEFFKSVKDELIIIASGSSYNAASCGKLSLEKLLDIRVEIITPYTFTNYQRIRSTACYLLISQSGNSVNTLCAAELLKGLSIPFHMITDNKKIRSDPFMTVSHLDIYNEEIPFVTLGFDLTVLMLLKCAFQAAACSLKDFDKISEKQRDYYKKGLLFYEANKQWLKDISRIHICGSGANEYCAKEGALKFCETLQIAATAYETEEFMHGGFLELNKSHVVFMISDSVSKDRMKQFQTYLPMLCDHVYLLDDTENIEEAIQPLYYIVFFQTITALMNRAVGNEIPSMASKYIKFEKQMKSKTIGYDEGIL